MGQGKFAPPVVVIPKDGGAPGAPAKGTTSSATPVSGAGSAAPVTASVASSNTSSFSRNAPSAPAATGGSATAKLPGFIAGNPARAAGVANFKANASPQTLAACQALGKYISANPQVATQVCSSLLEGQKLDNGEIVVTAPGFQDASGAPEATESAGAQTPVSTGATAQVTEGGAALSPSTTTPATATPATGGTAAPQVTSSGAALGTTATGGSGNVYGVSAPVSTNLDQQAIQNMGVMPPGGDISEMCFVVLMDATNDSDNDLELIMADTKAQTAAKQALRALIAKVGQDVAANAAQQVDDANGNPLPEPNPPTVYPGTGNAGFYNGGAPIPVPNPNSPNGYDSVNTTLWTKVSTDGNATGPNYNELKSIQDNLNGQLDSMNEMSEMTSMRLQMAMDRRSKFVEALSNIMKKIDSTDETIVQNMKG